MNGARLRALAVARLVPWLERLAAQTAPFDAPELEVVAGDPAASGALLRGAPLADLVVDVRVDRPARLSLRGNTDIRATRAGRRLQQLATARSRGLDVPEPLAAGVVESGGNGGAPRGFLVLRHEPDLRAFPEPPWPTDLARAAGELLRVAHDAGLHAPDLRAADLCVSADGTPRLHGLGAGRFANPPENDERADALAAFCAELDGLTEGAAGRAVLDGYGAAPSIRSRALRRAHRRRRRRLAAAGARALRPATPDVVVARDPGGRWLQRAGAPELSAAQDFATGAAHPAPRRLGRRGGVWLLEELVVKERSAAHARALCRALAWLKVAGVPAPEWLALRIDRRTARGLMFVHRIAAPHGDLEAELDAGVLDHSALCAAARDLGRSIGRLHAFGLRNRDLKLENLVRDPARDHRVVVVDLDGIRRRHALDARGEGRDLGRLLAAWRRRRHPAEQRVVRAFWRSYHRARRCLMQKPEQRLRQRIEARAREWDIDHPAG